MMHSLYTESTAVAILLLG